ncbi:MAG: twin-arginine translocase TatA/TatE family subunit, partial [Desulfuromusa sp.]|nr:twin-arginine translocase TatA/TatE family subunit [Desulfuromusa sp.]
GALGKGLRNFKKGVNEADEDIEEGQVEEISEENGNSKKDA